MSKVPWVVVRRLALARAMAIHAAQASGKDWLRMSQAAREKMTDDADQTLSEWVRSGLALQFAGEYREADGGGAPVVDWKSGRQVNHKELTG
jgi:hypothetical protein